MQDASCAKLEQKDSMRMAIVGALHAVVEGNKVNQLSFQAAGGLDVLMHLLAQASPCPQVTTARHCKTDPLLLTSDWLHADCCNAI